MKAKTQESSLQRQHGRMKQPDDRITHNPPMKCMGGQSRRDSEDGLKAETTAWRCERMYLYFMLDDLVYDRYYQLAPDLIRRCDVLLYGPDAWDGLTERYPDEARALIAEIMSTTTEDENGPA